MITEAQWKSILMNMQGLRSGATATDLDGATYAMDMGKQWNDPIPDRWEVLLRGTIAMILGFPDGRQRYLLIVTKSTATSEDYKDTFPKCSSKATTVLASTQILQQTEDALVQWVEQNIQL